MFEFLKKNLTDASKRGVLKLSFLLLLMGVVLVIALGLVIGFDLMLIPIVALWFIIYVPLILPLYF